jgi:hypothetical protein
MPFEVMGLEYERGRATDDFFKPSFSPVMAGVVNRLERVSAAVPADVPLGLHLCYGDLGYQDFMEPEDTALVVDLANNFGRRLTHPIN